MKRQTCGIVLAGRPSSPSLCGVSELLSQVERNIRRRRLFRDGQPILVAVSGGVDSMVLLRVLDQLSTGHRWQLTVAHLNHQLRGRSSDADERLVRRAAAALGWPAVVERAEVREFGWARGLSLEMAARKLRHDFLAGAAARLGCRSVALAHQADDQVELFFLRLLRGSGGEGLAGMKWRNPSPSDRQIALVRPFLDQAKADLRQWATWNKVAFREDATNALLELARNHIRHQLLPLLRREYQPALARTILRVMDIIGEEAHLAVEKAQEWLEEVRAGGRAATPFTELPVAVQRRCIQLQLLAQGLAADYELVEQLRASPERPVTVGGIPIAGSATGPLAARDSTAGRGTEDRERRTPGRRVGVRRVVRDARGLVQVGQSEPVAFKQRSLEVNLGERAGEVLFEGVRVRWRLTRAVRKRPRREAGQEIFDAERVGTSLVLRHWQPGDRFQPIGMTAPVKLQDLFTNEKVLRKRRHELIVAATAPGEVFWVEGLRISERFKLREQTRRRLQWRWQRF